VRQVIAAVLLLTLIAAAGWSAFRIDGADVFTETGGGWGIDACVSCHVMPAEVTGYLKLLGDSHVGWLRERYFGLPASDTDPAASHSRVSRLVVWEQLKAAGFRVLAFASLPGGVPLERSDSQLAENLLEVYRQSRRLQVMGAGKVDAWEMCGEPETSFVSDLPDRVVAYQKAVYLGLKAAHLDAGIATSYQELRGKTRRLPRLISHEPPIVLMGALGFPPGPWLEAAAKNGLYDYTDGVNFHHYGFVDAFTEVAAAQRTFAARWAKGRALPLWLTEVGLNNNPKGSRNEANARAAQAAYLVSCARQAIEQKLAIFMPFILVHRGDPYAMTESPEKTFPSWTAYRDFTLQHRLPAAPIAAPPRFANPVVLQWLPAEDACIPNKVSRSYWFNRADDGSWLPMPGEIRVYNLSSKPVLVRLNGDVGRRVSWKWSDGESDGEMMLAPESCMVRQIELRVRGRGYTREALRFGAETFGTKGTVEARSALVIGLETPPSADLSHRAEPLRISPLPRAAGAPVFAVITHDRRYEQTDDGAIWLGINGVKIAATERAELVFDVKERNADLDGPPMAVAALPKGLPPTANGFLRLVATDALGRAALIRVDLIDADGQRFSIVENFGRLEDEDAVYLGYEDFHPWFYGRCVPGRQRLDPLRVREIQLRFFRAGEGKRYFVQLEAVKFQGENR
jgi:hypothetical protein